MTGNNSNNVVDDYSNTGQVKKMIINITRGRKEELGIVCYKLPTIHVVSIFGSGRN